MNSPTARVGLAAMALVSVLSGCSLAESPKLTVVEAAIVEQNAGESLVMVTIDAENPNDEPLPLRLVNYRVSVDGAAESVGERSAEATLPANGKKQLRVYAALSSAELKSGNSYQTSGSFEYIAPGRLAEALYDLGLLRSSASFSGAGALATGSIPAGPKPFSKREKSDKDDKVPGDKPAKN